MTGRLLKQREYRCSSRGLLQRVPVVRTLPLHRGVTRTAVRHGLLHRRFMRPEQGDSLELLEVFSNDHLA